MIKEYEFDKEKCWYKGVCPLFGTESCRGNCPRYVQMYWMFELSGIPKKRQYSQPLHPAKADVEAFERLGTIKSNITEWVGEGNNLYIFSSNCGNGKTSWAIKLMSKYFDNNWAGNGYNCRGVFVSCGKLFRRIKNAIGNEDKELNQYLENIRKADLVIFDDVGEYTLTVYEQQILIDLINDRLDEEKANIFTSNCIDSVLEANVGKRLTSRILHTSEVVEFVGEDRR